MVSRPTSSFRGPNLEGACLVTATGAATMRLSTSCSTACRADSLGSCAETMRVSRLAVSSRKETREKGSVFGSAATLTCHAVRTTSSRLRRLCGGRTEGIAEISMRVIGLGSISILVSEGKSGITSTTFGLPLPSCT